MISYKLLFFFVALALKDGIEADYQVSNDELKPILALEPPTITSKNEFLKEIALLSQNYANDDVDEVAHYFNISNQAWLDKNINDLKDSINERVNNIKQKMKNYMEEARDADFLNNFKKPEIPKKVESFWEKIINSDVVQGARAEIKKVGGKIKETIKDLSDRGLDEERNVHSKSEQNMLDIIKFIAENANSTNKEDQEAIAVFKKKFNNDVEKKLKEDWKKRVNFPYGLYEDSPIDKEVLDKYGEVIKELEAWLKKHNKWHQDDDVPDRIIPGRFDHESVQSNHKQDYEKVLRELEAWSKKVKGSKKDSSEESQESNEHADVDERIVGTRQQKIQQIIDSPDEDSGFKHQHGKFNGKYEVDQKTVEQYQKVLEELKELFKKREAAAKQNSDLSDRVGNDERQINIQDEIKKFQNTKHEQFFKEMMSNNDYLNSIIDNFENEWRNVVDVFGSWTGKAKERFQKFVNDVKVQKEKLPCVKNVFARGNNLTKEATAEFRKCSKEAFARIQTSYDEVIAELGDSAKDLNVFKSKAIACIEDVHNRDEIGSCLEKTYQLFTKAVSQISKDARSQFGKSFNADNFKNVRSCYSDTSKTYRKRADLLAYDLKQCFEQ